MSLEKTVPARTPASAGTPAHSQAVAEQDFDSCLGPCPIERGMRIIGGKWKGSILYHLKDEPMRFNELARQLGGATRKVITQRLRELEANGLIERRVLSDRPISVSYAITDFGRSALGVLDTLKDWAEDNEI